MEDFGVAQDILNQVVETEGRTHNLLKMIDSALIEFAAVVIQKALREALHGPQRRAHVVRDAVGEGLQFVDRFPECGCALQNQPFQFSGLIGQLVVRAAQDVFRPFAYGDVANVALDNVLGVFLVNVADEFHFAALARFGLERQIFVANKVSPPQLPEGLPAGRFILEQADFPEFLAQQFLVPVAQ
jgi:hypothetical protein